MELWGGGVVDLLMCGVVDVCNCCVVELWSD